MRLLLKLESTKNCIYDHKYFHKLQGFVYNLLKETDYKVLHDKKDYKFFCFSNIFPIGDIKEGDNRNLLISSPDKVLIKFLEEKLNEQINKQKTINIGEMQFNLKEISKINVKLKKSCRIISATPIVIRIPEKNYDEYQIPNEFRKKRYVYWRPEFCFEAFLKQLEENLFKKYNYFYKSEINPFPVFEQLKFKKQVCNHVIIEGKEYKIIGSIWEFNFNFLNPKQKKILEFGIECGLGERNSLGFGFINVIK